MTIYLSKRAINIVILVFAIFIVSCTGRAYRVSTDAMKPTITRSDMCVMDPSAYSKDDIKRFDIVAFEMPGSEKQRVKASGSVVQIKRVVGLPGEKVELRDEQLYINGDLVNEPFEKIVSAADKKANFGPIVIPQNEYFLLGDNRPESLDSRYFAYPTIKKSDIHSKVVEIKKGFYEEK